tara:strand:+ start:14132 stop:15142 length:1011 start_codon:yes stop_codon:yes gene_type:complete
MTENFTKDRKFHLHIDNDRSLGEVFEVTPERLKAAMERFPDVADRLHVTVDYDSEKFDSHIATADALLVWKFDVKDIAKRAPNLRWIHATGAGIEFFAPLKKWLPDGVTFINNRGVHGDRAAEYCFMAVLMLNNRLPEMMTNQRAAVWQQLYNTSIMGKTLLVVGVGSVGGGAARWARKYGMRVIGVRRSGASHDGVDEMYTPDDLPKLVPEADYILVTAPATQATRHLMGKAEINAMKKGAGLVNYSRSKLVDYAALVTRLEKRELSAVLDVFDQEPLPSDSPLWNTPNLIITPHCSSDDPESYMPDTLDLMFSNIRRIFAGEPVVNKVEADLDY